MIDANDINTFLLCHLLSHWFLDSLALRFTTDLSFEFKGLLLVNPQESTRCITPLTIPRLRHQP
jgi:hypothetical protein